MLKLLWVVSLKNCTISVIKLKLSAHINLNETAKENKFQHNNKLCFKYFAPQKGPLSSAVFSHMTLYIHFRIPYPILCVIFPIKLILFLKLIYEYCMHTCSFIN